MANSTDPGRELVDTIDAEAADLVAGRPVVDTSATLDSLDHVELPAVDRHHYLVSGEIAKGGMGRVLAARDLRLGRQVAIKELLPRNRDARHRFEIEARITARLQHPAIIHIYEAGVWPGGEPFYAMPRIAGRSLDKVVAERGTLAERIGLLANVIAAVDALAYAHSQRIIHRDLKPANVLVGEFGETVVIDWGLAKDLSEPVEDAAPARGRLSGAGTVIGSVVGTPAYMPPEQARGDAVDERADVYALGALLYHVLAGVAPYRGTGPQEIVDQVLAAEPPLLRSIEPDAPHDLVAIVDLAMARDPARRYPTAAELAQDLKRFATGQLVAARQYSVGERVARWARRHRALVALTVATILTLGIVGALSVQRIVTEKRRAETEARKAESEARLVKEREADLLEEQGRAFLLDGDHAAAQASLERALQVRSNDTTRFLLAEVRRAFRNPDQTFDARAAIAGVAFTPDGQAIALAGEGSTTLWGSADDSLGGLPGGSRVIFDRAGAYALVAGSHGASLHEIATGTTRALGDPTVPVVDADLSGDGRRAVTLDADRVARVWDTQTGVTIGEPLPHELAVKVARFSPDGGRVVVVGDHALAEVWSVGSLQVQPLRGHRGTVNWARWSPDGARVVTAGDDGIALVFDAATGKSENVFGHEAAVWAAEFSPDGLSVVTASADHTARLWKLPSGALVRTMGHADMVTRAIFDAAGERIATVGRERAVKLWDATTGSWIATFEGPAGAITDLAFAPDGARLVVGSADGVARVWDIQRADDQPIDTERDLFALAVSPDGGVIAWGTGNGEVELRRRGAAGSAPPPVKRHHAPIRSLAFAPDGVRVLSGGDDGRAVIAGGNTPEVVIEVGGSVRDVVFSPDGLRFATVGDDGVALVWGVAAGPPLARFDGPAINAVAFSPDGTRLAVGGDDGNVVVREIASGREIARARAATHVYAVAFSHDGARVIAGGDGDTAVLWSLDDGSLHRLERLISVVHSVAFTPDDSKAITAGVDGTVRIWDATRGRLLATRDGMRFALSADGATLVTADADGVIRLRDLREAPP